MIKMSLGFIIIRHVNDCLTDEYWKESYRCIRKFYDNPILIVDDNSEPAYLTDIELVNCNIINTEYPGRGEFLAYYYFYKTHFVDKVVIVHDSVFINSYIEYGRFGDVRSLWSFPHIADMDEPTIELIRKLKSYQPILDIYLSKNLWRGCFGCMAVIDWHLLDKINTKHDLFESLLPWILNRECRQHMERILSCLFFYHYPESQNPPHIIRDIFDHGWGLTFVQYTTHKLSCSRLPLIKVWTGR